MSLHKESRKFQARRLSTLTSAVTRWARRSERRFRLGQGLKVVTIGSCALSHQLEGQRAGFINKPFEPEGTQGVELINWLAGPDAQGHSELPLKAIGR